MAKGCKNIEGFSVLVNKKINKIKKVPVKLSL